MDRAALDTPHREGMAGSPVHPQDVCGTSGLLWVWVGSLQVGWLLPGAQAPGRHPSNVAAGQEGNGAKKKINLVMLLSVWHKGEESNEGRESLGWRGR